VFALVIWQSVYNTSKPLAILPVTRARRPNRILRAIAKVVNGLRIVDLGGVHGAQDATVNIDAEAARLGITKGTAYAFDFFFVERHTTESNFRLETSLKFVNCDPILPQ
jgi:fibro-slime domain-containing protein